jgi:3-methyl-2-oxobutanoate hydroxymethyltransferase
MSDTNDKMSAPMIRRGKSQGKKWVVVTAYDATFARLLDDGGADILLVGDSLGMVVQGLSNTLPVTIEDMIYHTRAVARGVRRAQIVTDMPFLSFQISPEEALRAAGRLVKEGGAEAVKLEGGARTAEAIRRITEAGIPVMGHLGLTPQSVHEFGGFRVQGRADADRRRLIEDAQAIEQAGAYALVVEGVPTDVGQAITQAVGIPTIGIGAGPHCDGQVLVCYDFLGLFRGFRPKFVKRYAELGEAVVAATRQFGEEIRRGDFPDPEHSFEAKRVALPPPEATGASAPIAGSPFTYVPAKDEDA